MPIGVTPGYALANSDRVDITIYGKGGHGSAPQNTIDPIVIAARTVLALQTIVSREINPQDPAVVTVGTIHGGTRNNIIPDEVKLELTVRSLQGGGARAPARGDRADREGGGRRGRRAEGAEGRRQSTAATGRRTTTPPSPSASWRRSPRSSAPTASSRRRRSWARRTSATSAGPPRRRRSSSGSAALEKGKYAAAKGDLAKLPSLHSSLWAPEKEPTLKAGAAALTVAALELLGKP